jgi:hypothetical protein
LRITSGLPTTGKLFGCGEFESLPWRKRNDANVNKTGPTKTGRSAIGGLLTSANDDPRAKPPEQLQDSGKGDCSGCGCGFRLRTNAEISVMTSPIGKGSMNVSTALKNGFLYSSLYFLTC